MIKVFLLVALAATGFGAPKLSWQHVFKLAETCDPSACKLPSCRCSSTELPAGLTPEKTPQLVMFTFDDAVTALNFEYYKKTFFDKKNPDGCPAGVTFFLSHEYTDYSKVHELHARGYEIALHSITHTPDVEYWKTLSIDNLQKEFDGLRKILTKFAKVPSEDIHGMRMPLLQLAGNNNYNLIKKMGIQYDSSWPTRSYMKPALWPYTLDYKSIQDCPIGPCPDESIPGVWVMPMVDWIDNNDVVCSMVDACVNIPNDEDGLLDFFIKNFNRHYEGNRAPFGFYVHAAWFDRNPTYFTAYQRFVDYLLKKKDVYLVTVERARQWLQNPVPVSSQLWPKCQGTYTPSCTPKVCKLNKGDEERYMTSCIDECPKNYPWLDNPLGQ